jgi:aromatic-L-amino-acid decarboxylase
MNTEQFKKAGYDMIDYAINYMATIDSREPLPHVEPGWLAKVLPTEAPKKGEPWEALFKDFEKCVMEGTSKSLFISL